MFNLIKQQKNLFNMMVFSYQIFSGSAPVVPWSAAWAWASRVDSKETEDSKKPETTSDVKSWFEKGVANIKKDSNFYKDWKFVWEWLQRFKVLSDEALRRLSNLWDRVEERDRLKAEIQAETREALYWLKSEVTKELFSDDLNSTFSWDYTSREGYEWLSSTTKASIWKILWWKDLISFAEWMKKHLPSDRITVNWETLIRFTPFNIWWLKTYLKDGWYVVDWMFWAEEANTVYSIIKDYSETQKEVANLNEVEKLKLLLDFNWDWKIWTQINFSVWEAQMNYLTNGSLAWDQINKLFTNLWLWDYSRFFAQMWNNLYNAREKFKTALWTMIAMWVKPAELTKYNWTISAIDRIYKEKWNTIKQFQEKLWENKTIQELLSKIENEEQKREVERNIRLAWAWVLAWVSYWAWVSIDVKDYTKNFADSLELWFVDWYPVVWFSKEIFNKWNESAKFNLSTIWPAVSYTRTLKSWITSTAALSIVGWWVSLWYHDLSKDTSKWIEKELEETEVKLWVIKKDLLKETVPSYNDSDSKKSWIPEEVYNLFSNIAHPNSYKDVNERKRVISDLINAYLEQYKNSLYRDAAWFKFTWAWVALSLWFFSSVMPLLPYVTWERISYDFKANNHSLDREREISYRKIDLSWTLLEEKLKKWDKTFNVYWVSEGEYVYDISTPDWKVQAERLNWKLYFSYDKKIESISIHEHVDWSTVRRTIVINWVKPENWYYKNAEFFPIKSDKVIKEKTETPRTESVEVLNEAINATKKAREFISSVITKDALNHKHTPDMRKLQRSIFDYSKWKWDIKLEDLWKLLISVFNNNDFQTYAKTKKIEKTAIDDFVALLNTNLTKAQKELILMDIPNCLMNTSKLAKGADWKVTIPSNKTIQEYDSTKGRTALFDWIFTSELEDSIISSEVTRRRKEWYAKFWWYKTYKSLDIEDWKTAAFSAVQSTIKWWKDDWKDNVRWLMPFPGDYSIVWIDWKNIEEHYIKLELNQDQRNKIIDKLPTVYIEDIAAKYSLNTTQVTDLLKWKSVNNMKLSYDILFTKMWQCINDALIIWNLQLTTTDWKPVSEVKFWHSATSTVYNQANEVTWLAWAFYAKDVWSNGWGNHNSDTTAWWWTSSWWTWSWQTWT